LFTATVLFIYFFWILQYECKFAVRSNISQSISIVGVTVVFSVHRTNFFTFQNRFAVSHTWSRFRNWLV